MPLVVWTLLLGLTFGSLAWLAVDIAETAAVRELASTEAESRLREAASVDRRRYDEAMRGQRYLAKIVARQSSLLEHVRSRIAGLAYADEAISPAAQLPAQPYPAWLIPPALLELFPAPDILAIVDLKGRIHEIFRARDIPVSRSLAAPSARLIEMTRDQSVLKDFDGAPYVLSGAAVNDGGKPVAGLLLASTIDSYFLNHSIRRALDASSVVAVLRGDLTGPAERVIASSSPEILPPGSMLSELRESYLLVGDGSPHYGVAEMRLRLVTLVPRQRLQELVQPVVSLDRRQRTLIAGALTAVFVVLLILISVRVRRLSAAVADFTRKSLGLIPAGPIRGDELRCLESEFERLAGEVAESRRALIEEGKKRLGLLEERMRMQSENQRLQLLQSVTQTMGVGVIQRAAGGAVAVNPEMECLSTLCGGLEPFVEAANRERLPAVFYWATDLGIRAFSIDSPESAGRELLLVQDVTERKCAEEEMRLAAITFESREAIFITDSGQQVLRVNRAFTAITGFESREVVGKPVAALDICQEQSNLSQSLQRRLAETGQWQGEVTSRRKSGESYPAWLTVAAVADEEANITHYVCSFVDLTEVRKQRDTIARTAAEEQVLGQLLRLSHTPVDIKGFLEEALYLLLTSVPWLGLQPRGAVFLNSQDGRGDALSLVVSRNMFPVLQILCARVPFGQCVCGRAAQTGTIQYVQAVDHLHGTRFEGITDHGHYAVPFLSGKLLIGVLTLYLEEGHKWEESEESFLRRIADVLAIGVTHRRAEAVLEHQAHHDSLTGLPNRRMLLDRLQHELDVACRGSAHGALLFIDLDHFKTINDSLGHPSGDQLLRQVAQRLVSESRAADMVARLGGDEYLVLLPEISSDLEEAGLEARRVAEKLREVLARPYFLDHGQEYHSTPSIGIVLFPGQGEDPFDLLKHADTAMYRAKAQGRNQIRFFVPEMQEAADARLALEKHLRSAAERGEFELYFQPQIDGESGGVIGAEALIRWRRGPLGLVPPEEFIPVAEDTGLIVAIGEWALRRAVADVVAWRRAGEGLEVDRIAVNISPRQFQHADLVTRVRRILEDANLPGHMLMLEITEGAVMEDVEDAIDKMRELRGLGVRFSIDDFGTGYSSLGYLTRLPINQLKIDKSFVRDLSAESNDMAIIDTIIAMSKHLGLELVAEGVESRAVLRLLQTRGCRLFQGYLLGPPLPAAKFLGRIGGRDRLPARIPRPAFWLPGALGSS